LRLNKFLSYTKTNKTAFGGSRVPKDAQVLRIGILGCGPISQFAHLESVQKGRNVVLQGV
jgi:hypothetical protein